MPTPNNITRHLKRAAARLASLGLSVVYAYLLVAISGVFDLANAVVSCADVISSQTSYRYNETLYNFKYFIGNGKTYAVVAPGNDYFAFSPGFNYETLYGGTDTVTLKYQLTTGKYGAARPVAITSDSVKQFIVDNYGAYLGSDSTLVDAWKDYGEGQPFTAINGSSLTYTSWSTAPDTSIESPSAVAMNGQGVWMPTTSGTYTKQIVEFDGKLDCAIDPSVPYEPPTPPPPTEEEVILGDLANYDGLVCMGDINNDGELSGSFESAKCQTTSLGDFCPVGALDCDTTFQPPVCPAGSTLDTDRDMCQADHLSVSCPNGFTWESSIDKCVATPTCPDGGIFNTETDRCEKLAVDTCPIGYTMSGSLCTKTVNCGTGTYNASKDQCEAPAGAAGCPPGLNYNAAANQCEAAPECPSGLSYDTGHNKCLVAVTADICPIGYSWVGSRQRCEKTPLDCPEWTTYNASTNQCESAPICSTGTYNITSNNCVDPTAPLAVCPDGYTWDGSVCTSTYSATATYSCPDSIGVTGILSGINCIYNSSYAASCPSGYVQEGTACTKSYNATVVKECLPLPAGVVEFTRGGYLGEEYLCWGVDVAGEVVTWPQYVRNDCPEGGTYNGSVCITTSPLTCPNGGTLSGSSCLLSWTAAADVVYSCPSGGSLSGSTCTLTTNPTMTGTSAAACPPGSNLDITVDKCLAPVACSAGGQLDSSNDVCFVSPTQVCEEGTSYDVASGKCAADATCTGGVLDTTLDLCVQYMSGCPAGFSVNASTGKCEASPFCPTGWGYDTTRNRCEKLPDNCPSGYTYNNVLNKCVTSALCSDGGSLNGTSDKCEISAAITCESGWTYNSGTGKCEQNPTCLSPGAYNGTYDTCLAATTTPPCPTGYTYNSSLGVCTAAPICSNGTYNAATDRCEATTSYSCPDASYTYNSTRARCEKAPVCPTGMTYSATYNVCTQAMSSGCPSGYTYVSARNRCERQPPDCSSGAIYNAATNKCDLQQYVLSQDIVRYLSWGTFVYSGANNAITGTSNHDTMGTQPAGTITLSGGVFNGTIKNPNCSPVGVDVFALWGLGNQLVGISSTCGTVPDFEKSDPATCSQMSSVFNAVDMCSDDCGQMGPCGELGICSDYYSYVYTNYCELQSSVKKAVWDTQGRHPINVTPEVCAQIEGGVYGAIAYNFNTQDQALCIENGGQWETYEIKYCYDASYVENGICDGYYLIIPDGRSYSYSACSIDSGSLPYCWPARPNGAEISRITLGPGGLSGTIVRDNMTLWGDGWYLRGVGGADTGYILFSPLTENPTCPSSGQLDGTNDVCYVPYTPTCSQGTYDSVSGQCILAPTCSNGVLDGTYDVCYQASSGGCPSDYTLSGSVCIKTPTCNSPGAFTGGTTDACTATATFTCPTGYTYSASYGQCYRAPDCNGGGLNTSLDKCEKSFAYTCPASYTPVGSVCQAAPFCYSPGFYHTGDNLCDGNTTVCSAGLLDASVDRCYQDAWCNDGVLDTTIDKCVDNGCATYDASGNCVEIGSGGSACPAGYSQDPATGICYIPDICGPGAYNAAAGNCQASIVNDCSTYNFDAGLNKCIHAAQCPGPVDAGSLNYSTQLDVCVAAANHTCASGLTWSTVPVSKCEAIPVCAGAIFYDPSQNSCFMSAGCPYGTDYTCMPNAQGTYQCSPYECVNVAAGEGVELEPFSEDYLQDDGEKDAEGNCLGQIYIFNGKPSRCRTPGWTVGYINNCCEEGDLMPEDTGSGVAMVAGGYSMYQGARAAYVAYMTYNSVAAAPNTFAAAVNAISDATTAGVSAATQAGVEAGAVAAASGASQGGAMLSAGLQAAGPAVAVYAAGAIAGALGGDQDAQLGAQIAAYSAMIYAGLLSGPQAAVGIVIIVVMRLLMGTGCDVNDIMTSNDVASKRCHYIGTYCEKKILGMCVQKAKGHCCFNSILARIIHEQGRPQLISFQPAGAWGPAKGPNCRGFTPEEFQSLDFSKIDLTEYYGQVLKDIEERVQGAATRVETTIKGRFDQIQAAY